MARDVIFFDKDDTLGNWQFNNGFYPGAVDFIKTQHEIGRELYITTTSKEQRDHVAEIEPFLSGYFDRRRLNYSNRYISFDGTVRFISEDYSPRINFESDKRRKEIEAETDELINKILQDGLTDRQRELILDKVNAHFDYRDQLLHNETKEPFDESTRYQNPYITGSSKDLHLVKRMVSPRGYNDLRTVLVGDHSEEEVPLSDPSTPVIIVSDEVIKGNWTLVSKILDVLYSDEKKMPWQIFDEALIKAKKRDNSLILPIDNVNYILKVFNYNRRLYPNEPESRIIYCP